VSFTSDSSDSLLRRVILLDAAASGGMGLLFAAASLPLSRPLGLPPALLLGAGLFLVPFTAFLVWLARRPVLPRSLVAALVAGNALWAAASFAIIPAGLVAPTTLGAIAVYGQAAAVVVLATLEYGGLRRLRTA